MSPSYLSVLIFSSALSLTMVRNPVIFLAVSGDDGFVSAQILSYSRLEDTVKIKAGYTSHIVGTI